MLDHSNARPRTALVAGGAGFLGSHLCDVLIAEGKRVVCLDNLQTGRMTNIEPLHNHPGFSFRRHDICEPVAVEGTIDEVYNLACAASPPQYQADPVHTMLTCVSGTLNLLELAHRNGARFFQASTSEVYGDPDEHPQRESYRGNVNCTGPRACYDEGKRAAEALCFDFKRTRGLDIRVGRIFNTYGPRIKSDDGRIISNLIVQARSNAPLTIYGDGSQTRSFCYVDDLIKGIIRLTRVAQEPPSAVNLGNPSEYTVLEVAGHVLQMTGSKSPIRYLPLPQDDPRKRRPDISLAKSLLDWAPEIELEVGLERTIDAFAVETRSTLVG